ncbi:MAG: hypothetical protein R3F44_08470 [Candidatus Competibacteraceae bacterium]
MGTFEARKGNWALAMDLVYNDFSGQKGKIKNVRGPEGEESLPIDVNVDVDIKSLIWEGIGSYTVARSPAGTLDVFGGVRYLSLKTSTDLSFSGPEGVIGRSGGSSNRINVWDGIVGVRGAVEPSARVAIGSCPTISTSAPGITRTGPGRDGPESAIASTGAISCSCTVISPTRRAAMRPWKICAWRARPWVPPSAGRSG